MRSEGRALTESFFLHGLLAGAMIVMIGLMTRPPKIIRLDFNMLEQTSAPATKAEQKVAEVPPPVPAPKPKPEPVAAKIKPVSPKPIKTRNLSVAAVEPKPAPAPTTDASDSVPADTPQEQTAASGPASGDQTVAAADAYRHANFAAIRDSILANLHYPMIARRQGWSGKVDVAFLIKPDGHISELRIEKSSGYPVLDEQALDAIRRSAPFTPPRIAALLIMPVTFQLN
jgi:periplasmic protein TonB